MWYVWQMWAKYQSCIHNQLLSSIHCKNLSLDEFPQGGGGGGILQKVTKKKEDDY